MADATVTAAAVFNDEIVRARTLAGLGPALNRQTLRDRLDMGGLPAASPLTAAVFVGWWGSTSLTSMSRLGGYGQTILLTDSTHLDPLALAECDWRGIGVASMTSDRLVEGERAVEWLVRPATPSASDTTNLRFEQLLELRGSPASVW